MEGCKKWIAKEWGISQDAQPRHTQGMVKRSYLFPYFSKHVLMNLAVTVWFSLEKEEDGAGFGCFLCCALFIASSLPWCNMTCPSSFNICFFATLQPYLHNVSFIRGLHWWKGPRAEERMFHSLPFPSVWFRGGSITLNSKACSCMITILNWLNMPYHYFRRGAVAAFKSPGTSVNLEDSSPTEREATCWVNKVRGGILQRQV